MLLSIITVTYNCRKDIAQTIESVRAQKRTGVEYLVIDGGSYDGTLEYLVEQNDVVDVLLSESDTGIYDAMNKGVIQSTGSYKWFLNAGDTLCAGAVSAVLNNVLLKNPADILHGKTIFQSSSGEEISLYFDQNSIKKIKYFNVIPHPSTLISRGIFESHGMFDTRYKVAGDYEFFLRVTTRPSEVVFVPIDSNLVKMSSGGVSDPEGLRFSFLRVTKELFKIHCNYFGFFFAVPRLFVNTIYYLKKIAVKSSRAKK